MSRQIYLDANLDGASNPSRRKTRAMNRWWWWLVGAGIVALVLVAIFRSQWLGKVGSQVSKGTGEVANPYGWV
jgi:hypothetical protein